MESVLRVLFVLEPGPVAGEYYMGPFGRQREKID
jgi:hypothetical protein